MRFNRSARKAADAGGGTARRAVARWAWRMFRREWRQQVLVLALLTVAVAAAIGLASAAYTMSPVPGNAEFGSANTIIQFEGSDAEGDAQAVEASIAAAREWFDAIDVIGHRAVPVPGVFEPVDYRAQNPQGVYSSPLLALRDGDYPTGTDQVAVTDGLAEILRVELEIGTSLVLDGDARRIVGIVENPSDLTDEFVLVPPSQVDQAETVTVLVSSSADRAQAFRLPTGATSTFGLRATNEDVLAAVSVLVAATVVLLLVALVAAASFVVVAQRRMRQLGMLSAIGATEKQLRSVTVVNGALIGVVAAAAGAVIGFGVWVTVAPRVEQAVGYRIDQFDVPWWLIATGMLLAVAAGTAAAWWPARSVARVPTVHALSGRPPEPKPARRSAALAAVFLVAGVVSLAAGGDVADDVDIGWTNALLISAGTVAIVLGVLFASPLAVRTLAGCAGRLPVAIRLAFADLSRYRARSGAALAAISLVLGIAVTIVVTSTAAAHTADKGNLSDNQLLIRANAHGPFIPEPAELENLEAGVDRIVAGIGDPAVTALDVAMDPAVEPNPVFKGRTAITVAIPEGDMSVDVSLLYLATPQLLERYGLDLDAVAPSTEILTRETGELSLHGAAVAPGSDRGKLRSVTDAVGLTAGYTSLPGSFITGNALRERGWESAPSGRWLVETSESVTPEQLATAREIAAGAGLTIESRDHQEGLAALRSGATAAGILLALGVLAMTVGLVRSEAARDLRILTATGATGATRRTLAAATAGGLALLGVTLGTAGAYLGLAAGFVRDLGTLTPIPVLNLAVIALGLPLSATAAAWLVSGRAAADVARQPIE